MIRRTDLAFLFAAAMALGASSCASSYQTEIPLDVAVSHIDFRPYTEKGFLFTSESYSQPYDAVGLIRVTEYAHGHREKPNDIASNRDWQFDPIVAQDLVDSIYAKASAMGADALMNFRLEATPLGLAPGPYRPGLTVTGFAIKRRTR